MDRIANSVDDRGGLHQKPDRPKKTLDEVLMNDLKEA